MSYLSTSIERTDLNGVTTTITDWESIVIRKGLDQKANTISLSLKNGINRTPLGESNTFHKWVTDANEPIWEEEDVITVKVAHHNQNTALGDSDILTIADALEFNAVLEPGRSNFIIKGTDKTFNILNQTVARNFELSQSLPAPNIIKELIETVSENESGNGTFGITATLQTELTYILQRDSATPGIQTRRINDSLFPVSSLSKIYKPVYEWIDDLSTIEFTNNFDGRDAGLPTDSEETPVQNRKMRYFVNKDNEFLWFYPDDKIDYTITISSVTDQFDDVKDYNLTKTTFDLINFVIYNGGLDFYGVGTLNYFFDDTTKSKKLLSKYKAYTDISAVLIQKEINDGNLVSNTSGSFTFQGNRFNRNGTVTPHWSTTSVSDDDDYNDSLRAQIDSVCKSRARALTTKRGSPRWKGKITIKGRNFVAGETILLTSHVHGINSETLRILDLTHTINKNGWSTQLNVEEDEPKIGV